MRYQQGYYGGGYYPYPAHYAYYPTKQPAYSVPKKPIWPLALALIGILLIAYGFVATPKIDPQLKKYAALYPDANISAIVFCDPCIGIEGEPLGAGKVMVMGSAQEIIQMENEPGIKQIRFLGKID